MKPNRMVPAFVVALALGAGLAACDDGDSSPGPGGAVTSVLEPSGAPGDLATVPPLKVGPAGLALTRHTFVREKNELVDIPGGTFDILTVNGKTAYRFENDLNKPATVRCDVDCSITWPPVLVDGAAVTSSAGVDRRLVGSVRRKDGHLQVTYNGWPLYWFEQDQAANDAKGEGLGLNWSTVKPDGKPVFKKPTPPTHQTR